MTPPAALRLKIDLDALAVNWRWFARTSGVDAGAAVKANGYGLGVTEIVARLYAEGCRTFYVATWAEAATIAPTPGSDMRVKVLHGVQAGDMPAALSINAEPVLNSFDQLSEWVTGAPTNRAFDLMIDTGMNRLGVDWRKFDASLLQGTAIDGVHSHLACADNPAHPMNTVQLQRFQGIVATMPSVKASIAGSGGVCLGRDYALDHVRPGLGLYGGVPNPIAAGHIVQVVRPEARVVQMRDVPAGDTAGYGATWTAVRASRLAVLNVGYADGYFAGFSNKGEVIVDGKRAPVVGRVSMDLVIADVTDCTPVAAGDWIEIAYDLPSAAAASGLSQYELLTGLGARYERVYL